MSKSKQTIRFNINDPNPAEKKGLLVLGCRYDVILRVSMEHNFTAMSEHDPWTLCWSDIPLSVDKINSMKMTQVLSGPNSPPHQKFNHFPGMYEICRKDRLCRNLNRLKKAFPKDYNFFPTTWVLPADTGELLEYGRLHKDTTYIVKPDSGSQGKGIFLVDNLKRLCPFAKCVCQHYITEPFLIDGYKFDQRIYVLVTCVDPLRFYIHSDGLARFATVKYELPNEGNLDITYMHLTNYSLNKMSGTFDSDADTGTKRPMSEIYNFLKKKGYDVQWLKSQIDDIVVKTVVGVAPALRHSYRTTFPNRRKGCYCFEVLGFDILLDRHLNPSLIEVNHSPSFNLDTDLDTTVKFNVVRDVFSIMYLGQNVPAKKKSSISKYNILRRPGTSRASAIPDALQDQFTHEENAPHNWRLLFSEENPGKYAKFMDREYVSKDYDNVEFLKKKLEPNLQNGSNQALFSSANLPPPTLLRRTSFGQMYVDSRTPTPFALNHSEFLKYKYNKQLAEVGRAKKLAKKTETENKRKKFILPPQRSSQEDRMKNAEQDNGEMTSFFFSDLHGNNSRTATAVSKRSDQFPPLQIVNPTQRVQNALELLRKTNVQNFKAAVRDSSMTKYFRDLPSTPSIQRGDYRTIISPYVSSPSSSAFNSRLQPSSIRMDSARPSTSRNARDYKKEDNYSDLDQSKLPSVFKHAIQATQLQREETTRVKGTSTKQGTTSAPNRHILVGNSRHFKPFEMEINAERDRLEKLANGKSKVEILGVGATAKKVVEMVSTSTNSSKRKAS